MKRKEKFQFLIERSQRLYVLYKTEPVYIRALMIKNVNMEIIKLLTSQGQAFNKSAEVNIVLDHFEGWL